MWKDILSLFLEMRPVVVNPVSPAAGDFADWSRVLQADASLPPGLREAYRQTLKGFLQFCEQRRGKACVALAPFPIADRRATPSDATEESNCTPEHREVSRSNAAPLRPRPLPCPTAQGWSQSIGRNSNRRDESPPLN